MGDLDPTETSPLLVKPTNVLPESGDAPVGALPTGNGVSGLVHTDLKPDDDGESQGEPDRLTQYEGMPEVRAKLKYIMPAIAIGVRSFTSWRSVCLTDTRFFCRPEIRPLSCPAMQR